MMSDIFPKEITEITEDNFELLIERDRKKTILYCMTIWSGPSKQMSESFINAYKRFGRIIKFSCLDCEINPKIVEKLNIQILPAIFFFYRGRIEKVIQGQLDSNMFETEIKSFI